MSELQEETFNEFLRSEENAELAMQTIILYVNLLAVLRHKYSMAGCTAKRLAREHMPVHVAPEEMDYVAEQIYAEWRYYR